MKKIDLELPPNFYFDHPSEDDNYSDFYFVRKEPDQLDEDRAYFFSGSKKSSDYIVSTSKPEGTYGKYNEKSKYKYYRGANLSDFSEIFKKYEIDETIDTFYIPHFFSAVLIATNDGLIIIVYKKDEETTKAQLIDLLDGSENIRLDDIKPDFSILEDYEDDLNSLLIRKEISLEKTNNEFRQKKEVKFWKNGKRHFLIGSDYKRKIDEYGYFIDEEDDDNDFSEVFLKKKLFYRIEEKDEKIFSLKISEIPLMAETGTNIFRIPREIIENEKDYFVLEVDSTEDKLNLLVY